MNRSHKLLSSVKSCHVRTLNGMIVKRMVGTMNQPALPTPARAMYAQNAVIPATTSAESVPPMAPINLTNQIPI